MKTLLSNFLVFICTPFLQAGNCDECVLKQSWQAFLMEVPSLSNLSSEEVAVLANEWGKKVADTLFVAEPIREIDPALVEKLTHLVQCHESKIFMRHGEQEKSQAIAKLPANLQKIEMMRLPDNMQNSLTAGSKAELMAGMIVWKYVKEKCDCNFVLASSENRRAALPALSLGMALETDVHFDPSLTCVNYPPSKDMPNAEILKLLPEGTLPWEKQKVDSVIGEGTYDRITMDMAKLLSAPNSSTTTFLAITHNQQTNAVATLQDLPATRLRNFGFMVFSENSKAVFANGFYKK
jgi:hypothetical protein